MLEPVFITTPLRDLYFWCDAEVVLNVRVQRTHEAMRFVREKSLGFAGSDPVLGSRFALDR